MNRVQNLLWLFCGVMFTSMKKVEISMNLLCCTEFETTKIAADAVKSYCRLLVKLGLTPSDSKLIKLNCIQYKFS